jgi:hypothetical protein
MRHEDLRLLHLEAALEGQPQHLTFQNPQLIMVLAEHLKLGCHGRVPSLCIGLSSNLITCGYDWPNESSSRNALKMPTGVSPATFEDY